MLYYIILYKTTYTYSAWSDGKEGGMYICMRACVCVYVSAMNTSLGDGTWWMVDGRYFI